uniref:NADH-ubiquinone oxidoreductase chain 2 n=1 Tax=Ixodes tasmani TaxID=59654 RepID=A0A3R5V1P3_9ACAR|nr:NADH dehydrogenase subunit 2 [Ixodes tasmani]QAB05950.1 NADH dehydrogenase subunit 2 [Ixodes tasmani]QAB05963.1 NADH dehydrogenase subunit 2 [Ixodes tasmani]QAB05976.1 NADH dehydrogenase subunit 2 [Ixodes tasmani]
MMLMNLILLWIMIMSIIMSFSTNSWFSFWISMEINMMVFIPMMNTKNYLSCNSMIYYFIIQSMASSMFLFSSIMNYLLNFNFLNNMIIMTILIKLASAPFHSWFPIISEGLKMNTFFLLSTFQKLIPLQMISIFFNNKITIFIILSALIGSFGGFNQKSTRKILAFSSISHLSWMMTLIMCNQFFWLIYFIIYSFLLYKITNFLKNIKINNINNIHIQKFSFFSKFSMFSYFMSLAGLPPFMGFFLKWFSIILMIEKITLILLILISSSLINMYYYSRIMFPLILNINISNKYMKTSYIKTSNFLFINLIMLIMMTIFMKTL